MTINPEKNNLSVATVAVFAGLFAPAVKGGGPIRSTVALVKASPEEFLPVVITSDRDLGEESPLAVRRNEWTDYEGTPVVYTSVNSLKLLFRSFALVRKEEPSLLYFNSFFNLKLTIIPLLLWRIGYWGKPHVLLAPRGEFGTGALNRRTTKKRLYMTLFKVLRLHKSVTWHSTAIHETQDIAREWGDYASIVLRQNETLLPISAKIPKPNTAGEARFVFVGRIVEHKGLEIALQAFSEIKAKATFDIYGSNEDQKYFEACMKIAKSLKGSPVTATFRGFLEPGKVCEKLSSYDALIMPTAGENFGHVIAEALSASCPVITTEATPWTAILEDGAGIVVSGRDPAVWSENLQNYASLQPSDLLRHRINAGRSYNMWRSQTASPHVWTMCREQMATKSTFQ